MRNNKLRWGVVSVMTFIVYIVGRMLVESYIASVKIPDQDTIWGMGVITGATMVFMGWQLNEMLWSEENDRKGGRTQ